MTDLRQIITTAISESMSFPEYQDMTEKLVTEGQTSGSNQSEDLIHFTKLNFQRSKRVYKTAVLDEKLLMLINQSEPMTWIILTETWCGDAANSVPILGKLSTVVPSIELRIVLRDENLNLMDRFLTNGGRSIPKLIAINKNKDVLFSWGPRPSGAQKLYKVWKDDPNRKPYQDFHIDLQKWYNEDKGKSLQNELVRILSKSHTVEVRPV